MSNRVVVWLATWLDAELGLQRLLPLTLLLIGLNSVAWGLGEVVRGVDLDLLLPMATLGVLLGWGLAASAWPAGLAGSLALASGVIVVMGRVGRLIGALIALLGQLLDLAWDALRWPLDSPPDGTAALLALTDLGAGINILLRRLLDWLLSLTTGQPVFDPVAVALAWSLAVWSVAAWAGWMVRRRDRPLLGLFPAGALLVVSQAYGGGRFHFLLVLVGAAWLLLALVGHTARERRWQAAGIDFSLDIRLDLAWVAVLLSLLLVVLAGVMPSLSVQPVTRLAQRLIWGRPPQAGPAANSLGLEPPPSPPTVLDKVRIGGLPRRHLLGAGPELSEQVVMMVRPDLGTLPRKRSATHLDYYWRSLTYDRYTGHGWLAGNTKMVAYAAGESVIPQTAEVYLEQTAEVSAKGTAEVLSREVVKVQQEVQFVGDLGGLIHVAGALLAVDQPYEVAWRPPGDAFGATVEATTYQADSLAPIVNETQLRATGSVYPEWLQRRYLALPDDVPTRVLTLARNLTATEPTPYDRARAIEAYLRTFPYDLNIPPPPSNRDVVDYFLFDLQRGYCDYYATAMVVLARAAGLPARLVVGYASGAYDSTNERYLVTEADAHSWPEIYFPGYGWIEFEPTAGRAVREQAAETEPLLPPELAVSEPEASSTTSIGLSRWWGWSLAIGLVVLALSGLLWVVADAWWLRHLTPAATVERLYLRLQRYGRWLAVPTWAGETPYEFSAALAGHVADLTQVRGWAGILVSTAQEVYWLTDLYVQVAYSVHCPDTGDQLQAIRIWRRLRWRLWLAWVIHLLSSGRSTKIA